MLVKVVNQLAELFLSRLQRPTYLAPLILGPHSGGGFSLRDLLDGIVFATPKNRRPIREIWARRYGDDNWKYGTKLLKPKRNIVTCTACGSFHEIHTICRNCWKKVEEESRVIIENIRNSWNRGVIDKEVKVLYQGETAPASEQKRIVEIDRPRPLWFASNLSQKSYRPASTIIGPATESSEKVVRLKKDVDSPV